MTWLLAVVVVPAAASELPAGAFGDRAALKAAVDEWVASPKRRRRRTEHLGVGHVARRRHVGLLL